MDIFSNHRTLYTTATVFFITLSLIVAIFPAISNQNNNAPLPGSVTLNEDELAGKKIFIANGCVACHSQQVRNIAMDKPWGTRPSIAADYADNKRISWWMNTATLMGTERTGPDLTNVGNRQPSLEWHLLHLYNPRTVIAESIMPAYPWMFEWKQVPNENDKVISVPEEFQTGQSGAMIASKEALQLVAYLQSLKQVPLPDGKTPGTFLYNGSPKQIQERGSTGTIELDGGQLYASNCQACHQADGEGLKGAFPPLKGSPIVLNDNPEILIDIIMNGYNPREEYAEMPAVGKNNELTPAEITAIINHERSSWGNNAKNISQESVEKIISLITAQNTSK